MELKSVLKSSHDLKKNGYHILRKLHKMETCKGADKVYAVVIDNTYCFVLYVRALMEIISIEYPDELFFHERCSIFLSYLNGIAEAKQRINRSILASFLHAYTVFFNQIISDHHVFIFNQKIRDLWNQYCLMAYIATWGNNS